MKSTGPAVRGRCPDRREDVWGRHRIRRAGGGRSRGADRGVATVWVAVTTATLCVVFALVLALGQAVAARHRAGGAADLAALAAADRALEGQDAACEAAREVALAQSAVLVRCTVQGEIADVVVRSGFGPYEPAVRALAGPPAAHRAVAGRFPRVDSAATHRTSSIARRRGSDCRQQRAEVGATTAATGKTSGQGSAALTALQPPWSSKTPVRASSMPRPTSQDTTVRRQLVVRHCLFGHGPSGPLKKGSM